MAPFRRVAVAADGGATVMAPGELARAVVQRFRLSQIETGHLEHAGVVTRRGASVTPVPTKPFRLVPVAGSRPTLQHVMDFARVDIAADGAVQTESTLLRAPAGAEMVMLDVRVGPAAVHLFAHTAAPLAVSLEGDTIYGCTEFVFHFDPTTLASPESLLDRIGEWLSGPTGVHECRDGVEPLCIEP